MKTTKRGAGLPALALCLALCLAACTPAPSQPAATPTPVPTQTPVGTPAQTDAANSETADSEAVEAYRAALEAMLDERVLPDGTPLEPDAAGDAAQNLFALKDVDGDGRTELILLYAAASMAGQSAYVFDYDSAAGRLRTQLQEFPLLTFYDNGVIRADWSHNQGLAGSFWPYTLYRYDPATDSYATLGSVDAWDKAIAEKDAQGNPFPQETDVSGTGVVYYIAEDGANESAEPVDEAVYLNWVESHLAGAVELTIPFEELTRENIRP